MRYLIIFLVIANTAVVTACGTMQSKRERLQHNPIFNNYLVDFQLEALDRGIELNVSDVPVNYGDLSKDGAIGQCKLLNGHLPEIRVSKEYWDIANESDREQLMYHELFHCILKLKHDNTKLSIMNEYHLFEGVYKANKESLLNDAFNRKKNK